MAKRVLRAKPSNKSATQTNSLAQGYALAINPYPDSRCSTCPTCGKPTGQRKLPLFIHVDPRHPILLNYTCRFCAQCNLLIVHKHEIESHLARICRQLDPTLIGNDYLIMGVMPRSVWQEGVENPTSPHEVINQLSKFTSSSTLQRTMTGWFPTGVKPPIEPALPSTGWVKGG